MKKIGSLILEKQVGSYFQLEIKFKYHFWSKTLPDFVYFNFIGFLLIRRIKINKIGLRFRPKVVLELDFK